jgi:tyrosine decarboxylase/aromatic-L-amino-acid decarboxylase
MLPAKNFFITMYDASRFCTHLQAHSCFQKAVMIVGLQHWHKLPASSSTDFAVQPQQLAEAVAADLQKGLIPFYFLGTIGERSSCHFLSSQ